MTIMYLYPLLNSGSFWGKHSYRKISTKKSGTAADQVFLYKLTFQKWQKLPRRSFPWLPHVFSRTCFYLQLNLGLKRGQEEFYLYIRSCLWKEKKILYATKNKIKSKVQDLRIRQIWVQPAALTCYVIWGKYLPFIWPTVPWCTTW